MDKWVSLSLSHTQTRKVFYTSHIQSIIDYASAVWDSASGTSMKPLDVFTGEQSKPFS